MKTSKHGTPTELTAEQQEFAIQGYALIPSCISVFMRRMPCLRSVGKVVDLHSAAALACVKAARTYSPEKGELPNYFSVAIRNGMLREIQNELKTGSHSIYRIPMERVAVEMESSVAMEECSAMSTLAQLPDDVREWIEKRVFDGKSVRALAIENGMGQRKAKRTIQCFLDRLGKEYEDNPFCE